MDIQTWELGTHTLEFDNEYHQYIVDGLIVPSVTQILKKRFGHKYDYVNRDVLKRAADKGTAVHEAVESYCKYGIESDLKELRNFKFLQKNYGFEVVDNEIPIILFKDEEPIAAGRLDLVLEHDNKLGLGDIKRVSTLDKNYLAYQLNIYRIGFQQTYNKPIEFLKGFHLKDDIRKYVDLPINEAETWNLINEYMEGKE